MMIRNNLLYTYDEESKVISPLPASPFLLPAILVYCVVWAGSLISKVLGGHYGPENITATRGVDYGTWKVYRDRYILLTEKRARQGLTPQEAKELAGLQYPPWAGPGEIWTYK